MAQDAQVPSIPRLTACLLGLANLGIANVSQIEQLCTSNDQRNSLNYTFHIHAQPKMTHVNYTYCQTREPKGCQGTQEDRV